MLYERRYAPDEPRRRADRPAPARAARAAGPGHRRRQRAPPRRGVRHLRQRRRAVHRASSRCACRSCPATSRSASIERIGDRAAKRWGVDVGDRVAVEALIPLRPLPRLPRRALSAVPRPRRDVRRTATCRSSQPPGLWGAYADYMYLDPFSIVHRDARRTSPPSLAVMFNPLGAGFRWAVEMPRTGPGDTVLVLGPGQRGLASVIAARAAGADTIIVTGLDARRPQARARARARRRPHDRRRAGGRARARAAS